MKESLKFFVLFFLFWQSPVVTAVVGQECRDFVINESPENVPAYFADALLWKVTRKDQAPSYIFGTIHVSDPRVLQIPDPVITAMSHSRRFAMETVPEAEELVTLHQLMFYTDDSRLSDLLDEDKFRKTVEILNSYNMSDESIIRLKPWAAYLTMNYPINNSLPLDMVLLEIARQQDMQIMGLESITEQLSAFTSLDNREQIRLLIDTLCNYDLVLHGFEEMIALYLERDLHGLYSFSLRRSFPGDDIYDRLFKKLLIDRNHLMVERMDGLLREGGTFVAIGALHLTGQEGVLALLDRAGYEIEAVY
ncbi:MAG: TraB/GumN family protein [Gammaproteobacteria bacterium]|nr:TraB/GumN family protein [Gammaproteobacteria bacterium]